VLVELKIAAFKSRYSTESIEKSLGSRRKI